MPEIRFSEIQILPIKPFRSLIGFTSFILNNAFYVGGVAIHSTMSGGIRLVFPDKVLPNGKKICLVYPISKEVGDLVTWEVLRVYRNLLKEVREDVENDVDKLCRKNR